MGPGREEMAAIVGVVVVVAYLRVLVNRAR